ncbi:DUF4867 family protein [Aureibacillus halotolerans]|uniref:Uncharacterized protein DUF4867 n=1 Tax=Aureibacillus halotolerans TaxID=1508390 RepID=A0A4R6U404_9BACI|nr:DUF4867 family protein [Aureibacillus halotolerans]TDQ41218.1 uncharacterized protein DUF4867 [Aureibacillus halotolerans]
MLSTLQQLNPNLSLSLITDDCFRVFGEVLTNFPVQCAYEWLEPLEIPETGNRYEPSIKDWESSDIKTWLEDSYYGTMPVQIGYCNGRNETVNGLEYHQGDEVLFAATDCVLFLGDYRTWDQQQPIDPEELTYVFVPGGTALRLYRTTMHLSPCTVTSEGYKTLIILPEGTNTPIDENQRRKDPYLFQRNKWLIAHEEHSIFTDQGVPVGLKKGPKQRFIYSLERKDT